MKQVTKWELEKVLSANEGRNPKTSVMLEE